MRRIPWYLFVALGVGTASGLAFAWVVAPGPEQGNPPRSLRADYKDQWREAIAASYAVTGDLERARARLQLLGDVDPISALGAQAQRYLALGQPFEMAQELARLASDVQGGISSVPSRTQILDTLVPLSPTPLSALSPDAVTAAAAGTSSPLATPGQLATAFPTPSPIPSPTPMPSPSAPFRLASQEKSCDPKARAGLLQITVLDSHGDPMPGIEITVAWDQGADRFFTGLQPEIGAGYADYTMTGGKTYSLQVARIGVPVSGITAPICTSSDAQTYLGGLQLTFSAP